MANALGHPEVMLGKAVCLVFFSFAKFGNEKNIY